MTFTQAREKLGNRTSRKVANNTYLVDLGGYIGLRLHGTIIVSYHPDQTKVFTGGWRTVTTKARINEMTKEQTELMEKTLSELRESEAALVSDLINPRRLTSRLAELRAVIADISAVVEKEGGAL